MSQDPCNAYMVSLCLLDGQMVLLKSHTNMLILVLTVQW